MPSAEHESPIALARLDPGVGAWLLANVIGIAMPGYHHAREQPAEERVLVPRTYKADNRRRHSQDGSAEWPPALVQDQLGRQQRGPLPSRAE